MTTLFDPLKLGAIDVPNRIFMAPMTRARGTRSHVPTPIMADYYSQRASAGLIITEAIGISQQGLGWPFATGIWSDEQVGGWRTVTDAVHNAGGRIIAQLWHMGRTVHPSFINGAQPLSASGTAAPGHAHTYAGKQPYIAGRPMRVDEVPALLQEFRNATRNALRAGFDGVQVHAANGYLIDEFLRDGTNFRDDAYGGSIENRIRLLREVTEVVADEAGADRTGVRLTPNGTDQGVRDSDPESVFVAAAKALSSIGVAHLELREPPLDGSFGASDRPPFAPAIRKAFSGTTILNSDYDLGRAEEALTSGQADAIAFGRPFISNPDLPARFQARRVLAADQRDFWFTQGAEGYVDYVTFDSRADLR
ncbi:alkene reductase [Burkholderia pyrrocinia]|uniref:alkene reductase n=1 Tax=Burkholderia sp. IT-111MI5 TaxID=3026439 RepID=UPI002A29229B|nr:alkene reductase [Burkholderia pyrrocinia]EKS9894915.1 alkene reductase [Burkholderia pyrrocinia]EKS9907572.1 alkene reductase [Burkholderia pyrrocinia]